MKNIAVFASGTGTNFQAIYDAITDRKLDANLSLLVSDKPKSKVIEKARNQNIDFIAIRPKTFNSKEEYEKKILEALEEKEIDLIVLAGYMRLIGCTLLNKYPNKIINIHPSLLPSFKGIDAVGQAMKTKVKVTGVTVHYIDQGMDTGEIIAQEAIDISNLITRDEIETRIHKIEHAMYPKVINKILEDMQ